MVLLYLIFFPPSSDLSQFSYIMFRLNLLWPSWMLLIPSSIWCSPAHSPILFIFRSPSQSPSSGRALTVHPKGIRDYRSWLGIYYLKFWSTNYGCNAKWNQKIQLHMRTKISIITVDSKTEGIPSGISM